MNIKIKLTVTGSTPPNRTRSLVEPQVIEFEVPEEKVNAVVKRIESLIKKLESFKDLLKF